MDLSVAAVVRGEFLYQDTLFVDVGELKRHPRASIGDLTSLLHGKAPKDQVGHWYEAQLIHYGLARSKDKNAAKFRLLSTLNEGRLAVPQHLLDMETDMKKQYASAVRKAKTQAKSFTPAQDASKPVTESKKRKQDDGPSAAVKKTKVTLNVGGLSIQVDHDVPEAPAKKATAKSRAKKIPTPCEPLTKSTKAESAKKTIAISRKANDASKPEASQTSIKAARGKPTKSPAKLATTHDNGGPSEMNYALQPHFKKVATAKIKATFKSEPKVKPEMMIKKEAKIKKEPSIKKTPTVKHDPSSNDNREPEPEQLAVTGVYTLYCPQLEEQFPEEANNLRLFLCVDNASNLIWGGFELASKTGLMRINSSDISASRTLSFGWRALDSWNDGRLRFGKGCVGELTITPEQQVFGFFSNLFPETLEFHGKRRPGPLWCGRSAYNFQQEWDKFVTTAYGR